MKIKNTLALLFIVFGITGSYAAIQEDSLIHLNDIQFRSAIEKQIFYHYCADRNTDNLISLLMMHYNSEKESQIDAVKEINATVEVIRTNYLSIKNHKKQINAITSFVHKSHLKEYRYTNGFSEIFSVQGYYNCVSSTALYAIIFSKLGIEYSIHNTPTHVFLVAYPSTDKILIEATVGAAENAKYPDYYKSGYLKSLKENGIINKAEYEHTSADELFKKYFYEDASITLEQLTALQMRNFSLYLQDNDSLSAALNWVKKSYLLYPCDPTEYNIEEQLDGIEEYATYQSVSDVSNMILYIKLKNKKRIVIPKTRIIGEFRVMTNQVLLDNQDYTLYHTSYKMFKVAFADTSISNHIEFFYNYELMNNAIQKGWLDTLKNKPYADNAYKLEPGNPDLSNSIMKYFSLELHEAVDNHSQNSKLIFKVFDDFVSRFPTINNNKRFNYLYANGLMLLIEESFSDNKETQGVMYLNKADAYIEKYHVQEFDAEVVEEAFRVVSHYYFRQSRDSQARKWLNIGLKYVPGNEVLLRQLSFCD